MLENLGQSWQNLLETYEAVKIAAKKFYFSPIIVLAEWHPAHLLRLIKQLTIPRSESLNIYGLAFGSDIFIWCFVEKISKIHFNLDTGLTSM